MKQEHWRNILGYENHYQISDIGNVRSLTRTIKTKGNGIRTIQGQQIALKIGKHGYILAHLSKNSKSRTLRVHRLVGKAFVKGFKESLQINHIDCNKLNNNYDNLEWCTGSENMIHAYKNKLIIPTGNRKGFSGKRHKDSKVVLQLTLEGNIIAEHDSIGLTKSKGFTPQHVHSCCHGRLQTHKKFKWVFK